MGLFDRFKHNPEAVAQRQAETAAMQQRQAEIGTMLAGGPIPRHMSERLIDARSGKAPWVSTLTPSELRIARSHGIRPISSIAATCWMHYGWSWTLGHAEGWSTALRRLKREAIEAGANAVLDVKMRTVPLAIDDSMDFTLVGTAVFIEGMKPSGNPIVATVPALEFVKLLEADVVPTGIAVGAHYEWMTDWRGNANMDWMGNIEARQLSQFLEHVRRSAYADLRRNAHGQGNGVLAHINFNQIFEREGENGSPNSYLGRHIVVATTVDAGPAVKMPHEITMALDMHAGTTPLTGTTRHHQSYTTSDTDPRFRAQTHCRGLGLAWRSSRLHLGSLGQRVLVDPQGGLRARGSVRRHVRVSRRHPIRQLESKPGAHRTLAGDVSSARARDGAHA